MNAKKSFAAILTIVFLLHPQSSFANDGIASHAIGGLVFESTEDIAMEREDLFLSLNEVRVRYVFRNDSKGDITATVAFPIPDIEFDEVTMHLVASPDSVNFIDFETRVNGKKVVPLIEERAFRKTSNVEEDITDTFRRNQLPVTRFYTRSPRKKVSEDMPAYWTARVKFYWQQTFPAGQRTVVEHRYVPVTGHFPLPIGPGEYHKEFLRYYCEDAGIAIPWRLLFWELQGSYARNLRYILKTANGWKGPIGEFNLTIEMPHANTVLKTCLQGLERKNFSNYTLQRRNFSPDQDIDLLILGE